MPTAEPDLLIGDELKAFLESGVSVVVGTRDSELVPEITRAWGPRVSEDRRSLSFCVPLATSRKTLENLQDNGCMAVAFSRPTDYRAVQLKGRSIETGPPDPSDLAAMELHRDAFARVNQRIGVTSAAMETFWRRELETSPVLVRIRFRPEQAFNQTPGPEAGASLA